MTRKRPIPLSPLARVIHDVIDGQRAEIRLYPDLYSERVADAIIRHGIHPRRRAARVVLRRRQPTTTTKGTRK
ncbi:hypothetical protein GCM10025867_51670 (plasmid) [Frondihabitans sucicola]|uniref:Uncharacterized protein n=1 Tax=Frondihabitans sucicola TaxID=1268041 RepID=A0ABM8GWS9_9MICO|nr:hypothetical protein GCM10025867_51670 [Frondihabitans sucicola]